MTLDPTQAERAQDAAQTAERGRQIRKAALASIVGTTIEWYDYFLYGTAAALVFPKVFFPNSSSYVGALESFATILRRVRGPTDRRRGLRPLGRPDRPQGDADRDAAADGVSPDADRRPPGRGEHRGIAAPLLLVLLRVLQGVAVGGEWGGSVLLSMEWGDQKRRGLMGSWPQLGVASGLILGTGFLTWSARSAGEDAFLAWGLADPVPAQPGAGRDRPVHPSADPGDPDVRQGGEGEPVGEDSRCCEVIRKHPKEIVLSALIRMSEQMPFYVVTTFVLAYLIDDNHGYSKDFVLVGTLIASVIEFVLVPVVRAPVRHRRPQEDLHDRRPRSWAIWGFVYFAMLDSGVAWLAFLAVCLGLVPHAMQYGPQASLIAESFPTSLRYGGAGLGYQLASLVAGGPAALWRRSSSTSSAPATRSRSTS